MAIMNKENMISTWNHFRSIKAVIEAYGCYIEYTYVFVYVYQY